MRDVKISSLIRKSIDRSELIFFRPFNLRKWLALLLIAMLSGALGGGGFNFPQPGQPSAEQRGENEYTQSVPITEEAPEAGGVVKQETAENLETTASQISEATGNVEGALTDQAADIADETPAESQQPQLPMILIVLIVAFVLALSLLFTWLSARFRFIWLNAITENSAAIRKPFQKFKREGNALFKALLAIIASTLVYSFIILGLAFLAGRAMGVFEEGFVFNFGSGLFFFLGGFLLLGVPALAVAILYVAMEDFLITIMLLEPCGFRDAWKSFVEIYGQNKKDFWLYLAVKIGLGILSALLQIMLLVGWALMAAVVGAIVFGIPYFLFTVLIKWDVLFWIAAAVAGIPYLAFFLLLLLALNLPFAAFFRSFSLYYLTSLKTKYTPLPLE